MTVTVMGGPRVVADSDPTIGVSTVATVNMLIGYQIGSVTGALPSMPGMGVAGSGPVPRVMVRAA